MKRDTAENKTLYKHTLKQQKALILYTVILSLCPHLQIPRMTFLLEN